MPKVVSPIEASVEVVGSVKQGEYGPYRSVLFKTGPGEADKLWQSFKPEAEELTYLRKGVRVQLIPAGEKNGRISYSIVVLEGSGPTRPQPRPQQSEPQALPPATGMSPEVKRAIAAYVDEQADLLAFCWKTAQAKLAEHDPSEESIRCAASTLYIAAQRQFRI